MNISDVQKLIGPLHRRVVNTVARAVVKLVSDDKKMQLLQLNVLDGETKDEVEHFQHYGFTVFPDDDAEALIVCVGGKRDHAIAIAVADRRSRIGNLSKGEVLVYDKTGSKILLKANGDIEVTPSSGRVMVNGDVVADGISLKNHVHSVTGTAPSGGGAVVFAPTDGETGAPE